MRTFISGSTESVSNDFEGIKESNKDSIFYCNETRDIDTEFEVLKGSYYIWVIPEGCYEEEGYNKEIIYCPFCGKKLVEKM